MSFFKRSKKEDSSQPAESGDVHAAAGLKALDDKDNNLAIAELEQAVALGVEKYNLAEMYTILGRTYKNVGRLDEAIAAHKKSLEINPNYEKAWNNLGNTYLAQKQYAQAEQAMERAIECDPTYVFAMASLGVVYINRGKADKAVDVLEQATTLSPKMTVAHANLAQAYAKAGRFAEARQSLEQAKLLGYANWQTVQKRIDADEAKAPKSTPKPAPKPKETGVQQLETARREIEELQKKIGSAGDYLDRGRPGPEEKANTEAFIRENEPKAKALEAEFKTRLQTCKANHPEILAAWVQAHLDTLAEIITTTEADESGQKNNKTRLHVAKKTVDEWQEVLRGEKAYFSINTYFMPDYYERLQSHLPEDG